MSAILKHPDLTVIPPRSLGPIARVIAHGNTKYSEADWIGRDSRDDLRAALGHLAEYLKGSDVDAGGSGQSHVAHAAARLLFVLEREQRGDLDQHRWRPFAPLIPDRGFRFGVSEDGEG